VLSECCVLPTVEILVLRFQGVPKFRKLLAKKIHNNGQPVIAREQRLGVPSSAKVLERIKVKSKEANAY
jgi:hypothetical protein